jgi:NAD(P)-dependent dehydrogenase (short-subunit alcohol dehydrogenase family)
VSEKRDLVATRRFFTHALGHGLRPAEVTARRTATRKVHHMIIEADQVAVVTGAAQGLGRALAAGLIDRGVSVVLADTATERLHATAEEFTAHGRRVLSVITDVSDAAAVDALASRTLEHFGRVDVVVNNAGIGTGDARVLW